MTSNYAPVVIRAFPRPVTIAEATRFLATIPNLPPCMPSHRLSPTVVGVACRPEDAPTVLSVIDGALFEGTPLICEYSHRFVRERFAGSAK